MPLCCCLISEDLRYDGIGMSAGPQVDRLVSAVADRKRDINRERRWRRIVSSRERGGIGWLEEVCTCSKSIRLSEKRCQLQACVASHAASEGRFRVLPFGSHVTSNRKQVSHVTSNRKQGQRKQSDLQPAFDTKMHRT